jgi:hypothetical protein
LEDSDDYRGFEAAIIADYDAETAVERELVLRLASLLWRLRRIIAIETDLFRIQAEILRERRGHPDGVAHDRACSFVGGMDRFRPARVHAVRDGIATPDGRGADLRQALWPLHPGRNAGEDDLDVPDLAGQPAEARQRRETFSIRESSTETARPKGRNATGERGSRCASPHLSSASSMVRSAEQNQRPFLAGRD